MTVKQACEIAEECGLETIGEAILNIQIHASNLFSDDEINKELNELYEDAEGFHMDASVLTAL